MKHPRRRAAGSEPDIFLAEGRNAGAAGGKSAFTGQRSRHRLDRYWFPIRSVAGRDQRELAAHRIAEGDSMLAIPEGKAVIKRFRIFVGELGLPDLATVNGLVDP